MNPLDSENNPPLQAWARTTSGVVVMLTGVQFITGVLLAFYYVPSVDYAHATVSFIDRALSSGAWLRSLHHYGSEWLSLFAFVHVVRLLWHRGYRDCRSGWVASVLLLGLIMAAGGTGYSLPWDARAFFSTRVAEGLVGGLPIVGPMARLWLLGGNEISTLTLSRFFALHVLVTPFLILFVIAWRARVIRIQNFSQQVIAAGIVFLLLALWTMNNSAPLGPTVADAGPDYLPRPGGQFLWLFQTLKYVPGALGSIVGLVLPGIGLLLLLLLPWFRLKFLKRISREPQRSVGLVVVGICAALIVVMTSISVISDRSDPKTRQQLATQTSRERLARLQPLTPVQLGEQLTISSRESSAPTAYMTFCANCHGANGEGARQGALKFPPLIGVAQKPRRTVDDIVSLLNDPQAYGLEPPMRSFATKLSDQEKRQVAEWVETLK